MVVDRTKRGNCDLLRKRISSADNKSKIVLLDLWILFYNLIYVNYGVKYMY